MRSRRRDQARPRLYGPRHGCDLRRPSVLLDRRLVHRHDRHERRHPGADRAADGRLQVQRSRPRCRRCSPSILARSPRSSWSRRGRKSRTTASCTSCRPLCHAHGALLVLDEMITGFRWHSGGAQHVYGIRPDLSSLRQGTGQRLLGVGARRAARVHAPRRARSRRPAARVSAVDDARSGDARAGGGDRHDARLPERAGHRAPVPPGRAPARAWPKRHPSSPARGLRVDHRARLAACSTERAISTATPRKHSARCCCRRRSAAAC